MGNVCEHAKRGVVSQGRFVLLLQKMGMCIWVKHLARCSPALSWACCGNKMKCWHGVCSRAPSFTDAKAKDTENGASGPRSEVWCGRERPERSKLSQPQAHSPEAHRSIIVEMLIFWLT